MQKQYCHKKGCKCLTDYLFCWTHRNTKYSDTCRIHGKTTFQCYKCLKCEALKRGVYRIVKRGKCYYFNNKKLDSKHFLAPLFALLTTKNKKQHFKKHRITSTPGIYGIFYKDKCLYIGQSVNVLNRISQHKKCIKQASYHVRGLRSKSKIKNWKKLVKEYKVEKKYYILSQDYGLKNVKFIYLFKVGNDFYKLSEKQRKQYLTFLEQNFIDTFKPKLNTFAARPTL